MKFVFSLVILFTIHCSLFTFHSSAQSWQELMDSTKFYQEKQDFQTAIIWAKLSLLKAEKEFGKDDTSYASTLGSIAELFYYSGQLDSAINYQERELRFCRKYFKSDHPDLANSIIFMAYFYNESGKYPQAEQLYKEALEMRRGLFKGNHPDLASNINSMASFYQGMGRYAEAEPLYKEALEMYRRLFKDDQPDLANSIINMAVLLENMCRYAEAEPLFKEGLEMCRRLFKDDHPDLAGTINNMAGFYRGRGRYAEAEPLYKEALEMYRRLFKTDHQYLAGTINNMAGFYHGRGRFAEAEPLFMEALDMFRRLFKDDHPYLAVSINNMAEFYNGRGKYVEAETLFIEALEIYRRLFKGDHPDLARSIRQMAAFYNGRGRYVEAESLFKEALEMSRRLFNGDHPDLANSIINMALLYNSRGCYAEAETLHIEALEVYLKVLTNYFPSLSEKEKEQFWATIKGNFESFNSFVVKREKDNPTIIKEAYNNMLMTKGILFSSTQKVKNNILNSGDKDLIRKLEEWQFEKDKISKLYKLSQQQLKEKNINLDSIIASANDKEKELSKLAEGFSDAFQLKQFKWEDVQNILKSNDAAIELVRFRYFNQRRFTDSVYYAALIIKKNSKIPELVLLKNGNELENDYISNYYKLIQNQLEDKDSYTQFWEPIAKKLKGIKRVYLSPDGVYNQLNLATLLNPKTEHYLSDEIDIRVVTSTRDLVEKIPMNPPLKKGEMVVELFGDPMFNLDSTKHLELANSFAENRTIEFYYLGNTLDSNTRGGIMPLPSSRIEIEMLADEFSKKGWKVISHLGEKALEEAVKAVNNPNVLHIATHGKFLKDAEISKDEMLMGMEIKRVAENPLLRSFLLFSGAENTLNNQKLENQNIDDGLLTAYEAMNLNLDKTDLVVLSACETGLGEIKNGEGVYGLQRAFRQAGAKSIIMSLWSVPDKETQELMTNFYSKWLNGKDKRTAFNEARNEMRDKYHYPYFWGGFVMVGE